jgi:hypothetical protein
MPARQNRQAVLSLARLPPALTPQAAPVCVPHPPQTTDGPQKNCRRMVRRKPSFFKDAVFLLIGPAWLMSFVYKKIGQRY